MTTATTSLNFMGADFVAEIELTITSFATRQTFDDPGWGPEFDIESITLREERIEWVTVDKFGFKTSCREWLGPPFEATGALFQVLAASRAIDEAILSTIQDESETDDLFSSDD
jgi:hypothetical protein